MIINVSPDAVLWSGVLAEQKGLELYLRTIDDAEREGLDVALATLVTHLDDENVDPHTIKKVSGLGHALVHSGHHKVVRDLARTLQRIDAEKYGRAATAARAMINQAFRFALTSQATERAAATLGAGQRIIPFRTFEDIGTLMRTIDPEFYDALAKDGPFQFTNTLEKVALDWERDFEKAQKAVSYLVRTYVVCSTDKALQRVLESNSQLLTAEHIRALQEIKEDRLLASPGVKANLTRFINRLKSARRDLF